VTNTERHWIYVKAGGPGIYLNPRNSEGYRKAYREAHNKATIAVLEAMKKELLELRAQL